jgi:phosphinothricin acetyltransferase
VVAIRPAHPADLPAVTAIYNAGIAARTSTFETRPREVAELAAALETGLPFLVAVEAGAGVLGFARVSPASDRDVYAAIGEHTVYVRRDARGRGLGRRLLEEVAAAAERQGFTKLMSRVFTTNAASRAAHRAAGFREVGVQLRHARLDGEWRDCVLVERLLGEAAAALGGAVSGRDVSGEAAEGR